MQELYPKTQHKPRLFSIAPLTASICWGFAIVNIGIGLAMSILYFNAPTVPIAVANLLSYREWGIIYAMLGFIGVFSLLTNNWKLTRNIQLAGLAVKSIWLVALIIRTISAPPSLLITMIWLFFAFVQSMVYIFFTPIVADTQKGKEQQAGAIR